PFTLGWRNASARAPATLPDERRDRLALERREVDAIGAAVLRFNDYRARVGGIDTCVEPVAAADVESLLVRDAGARARRARNAPVPVVLQAAADRVRVLHVRSDLVELPDRQVVAKQPADSAVQRYAPATVAADHQMIRVVGIDPKRVILGVDGTEHVAKLV